MLKSNRRAMENLGLHGAFELVINIGHRRARRLTHGIHVSQMDLMHTNKAHLETTNSIEFILLQTRLRYIFRGLFRNRFSFSACRITFNRISGRIIYMKQDTVSDVVQPDGVIQSHINASSRLVCFVFFVWRRGVPHSFTHIDTYTL